MHVNGITGVSASEVELASQIQFFDGMETSEIQETLIKAASNLISEDAPNYQYVAGRLVSYHLRKEVYGQYQPRRLYNHVQDVVEKGFYEPLLLEWYTEEEWDKLNYYIRHERDDDIVYAGMEQFREKYLVKDRSTGRIYETPQIAYILIAATLFHSYPKETRLKWVKDLYDAISTFDFTLPTPIMAGVRTTKRQFSSCVLIDVDDSLESINAGASSIVKYVSNRAGIGLNIGRLRAIGSKIGQGHATHTGVIPFIKYFLAAVKSCSQGGVRGGAATFYYPFWHYETEELLVLKNNRGVEDNRARGVDYGVQLNRLMYQRLIEGGNITLFSPNDVPGMYEAFFSDQEEFEKLYKNAENNPNIRKKSVKAIDLFASLMQERKDTGRIYIQNVDNTNNQSSFVSDTIYMSNLCCEITLPTRPLNNVLDEDGEIALCTLAGINWGKIKKPEDFEKPCTLAVRALDALLTYQEYVVPAAATSTDKYRPLGIGIINLAYFLAKEGLSYEDPRSVPLVDQMAEAWSYYLIKASADLAIEFGPISGETQYEFGWFPFDKRKKDVDELIPHFERMDWNSLRKQMMKTGIRNATLMALMPSETSSQLANATNGVEPPRSLVSIKESKNGVLPQVVPEIRRLKNKYVLLWDMKSPEGYLNIMAILQKYIDQSISVNTTYNPLNYENNEIPLSVLLTDLLNFYKYGGKCLYYFNTFDGSGEVNTSDEDQESNSITLTIEDEENCDGCIL